MAWNKSQNEAPHGIHIKLLGFRTLLAVLIMNTALYFNVSNVNSHNTHSEMCNATNVNIERFLSVERNPLPHLLAAIGK